MKYKLKYKPSPYEGKTKPFFEEVTERIGEHVLASKIRDATPEDIEKAKKLHKLGKCPHNIVFDTLGYMYDFRECFICGKGLGTV
jgi:hypothetical protein